MRTLNTNRVTAALLAASLALPVAAWAASGDAPAAAGAPAQATGSTPAPGSRQANVEQRIADMHATLRITAAQAPQWDQFSQVMLDNAQAMDSLLARDAGAEAKLTAQQILQNYAAVTQQHAQNVARLSAAFDRLYVALSAEQKQAADEMFRSRAETRQQKAGG